MYTTPNLIRNNIKMDNLTRELTITVASESQDGPLVRDLEAGTIFELESNTNIVGLKVGPSNQDEKSVQYYHIKNRF